MTFDFRNPDYLPIFNKRAKMLQIIRSNPDNLEALKIHYKNNIADFIDDWGMTFDPRNVDKGIPAWIPFKLMPKQREWINWLLDNWQNRQNGLTEKSRDCGISWLSVAVAASLCLFYEGVTIGFGSRKEEYVDKSDSPKSLFFKARRFLQYLPPEFLNGFDPAKDSTHMKLTFRSTKSYITGESGDGIGRGDRCSIYFVDESAFLERPHLVDASLSATTNCRIDISSCNGRNNPFADKRFSGKVPVFTFHWRDDPRKDDVWYQEQQERLDPVTLAQEIDINYNASAEGVLIPSLWVQSAIDSHIKLGIIPTGANEGALDIADEGRDKCAYASAKGIYLNHIEEWSGKESDTFATIQKAFAIADSQGHKKFRYDSDGLGALVRGDARVINEGRSNKIEVVPFRGSAEVLDPDVEEYEGRKNKDYFANYKAQSWFALRKRFMNTYRAVVEGQAFNKDEIISLNSKMPLLNKLVQELSQPTYSINSAGKMLVDKAPKGSLSPNLADSVMMRFAPQEKPKFSYIGKIRL